MQKIEAVFLGFLCLSKTEPCTVAKLALLEGLRKHNKSVYCETLEGWPTSGCKEHCSKILQDIGLYNFIT